MLHRFIEIQDRTDIFSSLGFYQLVLTIRFQTEGVTRELGEKTMVGRLLQVGKLFEVSKAISLYKSNRMSACLFVFSLSPPKRLNLIAKIYGMIPLDIQKVSG